MLVAESGARGVSKGNLGPCRPEAPVLELPPGWLQPLRVPRSRSCPEPSAASLALGLPGEEPWMRLCRTTQAQPCSLTGSHGTGLTGICPYTHQMCPEKWQGEGDLCLWDPSVHRCPHSWGGSSSSPRDLPPWEPGASENPNFVNAACAQSKCKENWDVKKRDCLFSEEQQQTRTREHFYVVRIFETATTGRTYLQKNLSTKYM